MAAKRIAAFVLRRTAPRTVHTLETLPGLVRELQAELAALRQDLEGAGVRAEKTDDEIARLHHRVDALDAAVGDLDSGLDESRRLSLRVAQMTDLVFDRLGAVAPSATTARAAPGAPPSLER